MKDVLFIKGDGILKILYVLKKELVCVINKYKFFSNCVFVFKGDKDKYLFFVLVLCFIFCMEFLYKILLRYV